MLRTYAGSLRWSWQSQLKGKPDACSCMQSWNEPYICAVTSTHAYIDVRLCVGSSQSMPEQTISEEAAASEEVFKGSWVGLFRLSHVTGAHVAELRAYDFSHLTIVVPSPFRRPCLYLIHVVLDASIVVAQLSASTGSCHTEGELG